jgi:hypothetical protein
MFDVVAVSVQLAVKTSPRKAFSGFLRLMFSGFRPMSWEVEEGAEELPMYVCAFRLARTHLRTRRDRFSADGSRAGAANSDGRCVQHAPASTTESGARR